MKKTFAFLTKDSFRVEVKASSPLAAYKKLKDIPHIAENITASFIEYDKDGLANLHDWKTVQFTKNDGPLSWERNS
jgi:hypothetical protein